jgi:hypothetical protein
VPGLDFVAMEICHYDFDYYPFRGVPEMTESRFSLSAVCSMGMTMASMERML